MKKQIENLIISHGWKDVMIYDLNKIEELYKKWHKLMPKIRPFYAIKCNSNIEIIKKLNNLGAGFDCASKDEISKVLNINKNPDNIAFSNPCKYEEDIKFALKNDIKKTVFDSVEELKKISKINRSKFELILRIYANDKKAKFKLSKKYGAYDYEWKELFETAKDLNLNIKGISFHIGSGAEDKKIYKKALKDSKNCLELAKNYGYNIDLIDIGGGFSENKIEEFSKSINDSIEEYFKNIDINFIAEPGRYFSETCVKLYTRIFGKKERKEKFYYWVSDGVYGCFNCQLHGEYPPSPVFLTKMKSSKKYNSTIFGPTCDNEDQILENFNMPELNIGDYIIWNNMGAYTIVACTDFNGIDQTKPMAIYIEDNNLKYRKNIV
ncbi:MAG: type III PLP-dependent enzyme [Bacteroidetes bacterium]|nr:type III PLP-dependent enzyme [Bacteroidota bacterium]